MATGPGTSKNLANIDNILHFDLQTIFFFGECFFVGHMIVDNIFCWPNDWRQYFFVGHLIVDNIFSGRMFADNIFSWPYDCRQYFLAVCFAPACCFSSNPPLVLTSAVQATDQDLKLCLNYNFFWESFRRFFLLYFQHRRCSSSRSLRGIHPLHFLLQSSKSPINALLCLFRICHFGFVIKHS